jgi:DNA-binding NarL/FixJ family response regulator
MVAMVTDRRYVAVVDRDNHPHRVTCERNTPCTRDVTFWVAAGWVGRLAGANMRTGTEAILLVADDALARAAIARLLKGIVDVVGVGTIAEARDALGGRAWGGFVVDVTLPAGNGLYLLAEMRKGNERVPALVVTEHCTQEFVNRAFSLRASYLCKPYAPSDLMSFAKRSAVENVSLGSALTEAVGRLAERHQLTRREVEIVSATMRGVAPKELVAALGISMNTYKTQVRKALRKIGASSLGDVRDAVLGELDR